MSPGAGNCTSMEPMYIQHVSGQGNVIGPYRPAMDFAWKDTPDKTVCPGGLIGCVPGAARYRLFMAKHGINPYRPTHTGQRQSLENYTASLRSWCSENRVGHPGGYTSSYIRIPGGESTVDPTSGGIRHTIIILNATTHTKPPMLRVTPKEVNSGVPLRYFVSPVGATPFPATGDATELQERESMLDPSAYTSLFIGQRYGINAPLPELQGVDLPPNYLRKNLRAHLWLYVVFFLVPIGIAWYYMSTAVYEYGTKPFVYNATFVRGPLLLLGMYVGSLFYCLAQASIILSHTTRGAGQAGKSRLLPGGGKGFVCIGFGAMGVAFNAVHITLWALFVTPKMDLVSNTLYLNEVSDGSVILRAWGSNLLAPLLLVFLLVEPITTAASHTAAIVIGLIR